MVAVYIDPLICHSAYWWMFPECWGVAVYVALPLALCLAYARRRVAR